MPSGGWIGQRANNMRKLSATALSTFLRSPKKFYWQYVYKGVGLEPLAQSVTTYDHDKLFGVIWASFTDRFYKGMGEVENTSIAVKSWAEDTQGWVPYKTQQSYEKILIALATDYYTQFSPTDGARTSEQSEMKVEDDLLLGFLDGLSADGVIHEVKSTSRSQRLDDQLWKFQQSIQAKVYLALAETNKIRFEFAYKDAPVQTQRMQTVEFPSEKVAGWAKGIRKLAEVIYSLGDDPDNYVCAGDSCSIVSKRWSGMCPFQALCEGLEGAESLYQLRKERKR